MVDSHCHLADPAYASDIEAVLARARSAGLSHALCVIEASDPDEPGSARPLCELWDGIRLATGVHPHRAASCATDPVRAATLVAAALAADPRFLAIGEIGLDYHYDFSPRDVQRAVFSAQISLARELGRPVIIHTREADADTLEVIEKAGGGKVTGVFHCFSGDTELANRAVAMGFYVSFSGIITFKKADAVRAAASAVPLERILVETDSPYLAPVPHRGARNEPAWVTHVADELARLKGVRPVELSRAVLENFDRLFHP